jgi:hypothetical protein
MIRWLRRRPQGSPRGRRVGRSIWADRCIRPINGSLRPACLPISSLLTCILIAGCSRARGDVVWTTRVASPDGSWYAVASTIQNGGFGSGAVETTVALNRRARTGTPQTVLLLSGTGAVPHPYTRDNAANKGGTVGLTLNWTSPTRLLIAYTGSPTIYLETVRYQGITITVDHDSGSEGSR